MAIALTSGIAAAFIGVFACREWWLIGLTSAVPLLVGIQRNRRHAGSVAFAYYGAASWPLVATYQVFTGQVLALAILVWLVATVLLALPFVLAWTQDRTAFAWRMPFGLMATAIPPLGLIGWGSPLTAAGVLFPGTAWFGLAVAAVVPGLILNCGWKAFIALFLGSLAAQLAYVPSAPNPNWQAVNTSLVPLSGVHDPKQFNTVETLQSLIADSTAAVSVLPESVITRWTQATELFWQPTLGRISSTHHIAIIGAGLPIPGSASYANSALIIGGPERRAFLQRVPVPLGMWRPFLNGPSVPLRIGGPGTMDIAGERVAFLICYEQLLAWPMLQSAIERPTVIIGMANQYWVRETRVPATQRACLKAWARLFTLPLLISENR